jgi:hypothetical protein
MIQYEYKFRALPLTDQQRDLIQMNLVKTDDLNDTILKVINEEGKGGWEAIYPFLVDVVWFRRIKETKRTTKK